MDIQNLRQQYSAVINEAKSVADAWRGRESEMTPEVTDKLNGLLGKTDVIRSQVEMADKLQKGVDYAAQPATAPVGWRPAGPNEGDYPIDRKAWRSLTVKTAYGEREIRYHVPIAVESKGYASAFEAYLTKRGGQYALGPTDAKTLTEGTDSAGGFVVPPDFQAMIIRKQMTLTQVRANAFISTTSRDAQQWPKINYASASDDPSGSNFTSSVRLSWTGETPASSAAHRVNDPITGLYTVPVHTAMASIPLSNDMVEDAAVDMADIASTLFGEAFALGEENAFINGNGVGQPMGIMSEIGTNGPPSVATANTGSMTADDVISLFYQLPVQYRMGGKWTINSPIMQALEKLKDGQGRYLVQSLLQASLQTGQIDVLKGKPILVDEFMPGTSTGAVTTAATIATGTTPILFGDWGGYLVLDRVGLSIQKLSEIYAELNLTVLLGRKRVGGYCIKPWQFRALKVA